MVCQTFVTAWEKTMKQPDNLFRQTANIATPGLVIMEPVLEKNIRHIHAYADAHGFRVRPHVKTHKSRCITRMQMAAGAYGIAVAKAGEAKALTEKPGTDITVAYPALGDERIKTIAELAARHTVRVAADDVYLMDRLAETALAHHATIGILIIYDAGLHRCGTAVADEMAFLARRAQNTPGLRYDGIQLYLGHLYGDTARSPESFDKINAMWGPAYQALCRAGLEPATVSSGSSPSLFNTHKINHVNEIRVGTAYLNDYFELKFGHCTLDKCAGRIIATVISDKVPGQVIIDAGSKALSAKQLLRHEKMEMGYVCEYPNARIFRLHEEHGWVDVSHCKTPPGLGQRISIIPVNMALCMNLFNDFILLKKDGTMVKESIQARGCLI